MEVLRALSAVRQNDARSSVRMGANAPPYRPNGVRSASQMKASGMARAVTHDTGAPRNCQAEYRPDCAIIAIMPQTSKRAAPPAGTSSDPNYMLSLARGLSVIRAFENSESALSVAEVARRSGISRAAARRCLHTLACLEYVVG